jgi:hypothetical protein
MPIITVTQDEKVGGLWTEAGLDKNCETISEEDKRSGGMVKVTQWFPSKLALA